MVCVLCAGMCSIGSFYPTQRLCISSYTPHGCTYVHVFAHHIARFAVGGSAEWRHVGLVVQHSGSLTNPTIQLDNSAGLGPLVVSLTSPSYALTSGPSIAGAGYLSRSGGVINGVVTADSYAVILVTVDNPTLRLELPQTSNVFVVGNSGTIARLNDRNTAEHTRFK